MDFLNFSPYVVMGKAGEWIDSWSEMAWNICLGLFCSSADVPGLTGGSTATLMPALDKQAVTNAFSEKGPGSPAHCCHEQHLLFCDC